MTRYFAGMGSAIIVAAIAVAAGANSHAASSAELPKASQEILKKLKLEPSILDGIDDGLKVPDAWIEGAKKEEELRIGGTWEELQFEELAKPFLERYPFIKVKYARATRHDRVIKPLMAYQSGRIINDVISGIGAKFTLFKKLKAVENLSVLPNWSNVPEGMKHPEGLWIGQRLRYWCMSYNTKLVKKEDLPKRWEDIVTNKRWHGKKIGMGNRPNLWLVMLWGAKGEEWAKNYARDLFSIVDPQLRKEGMNALIGLAVAGEFHAALPSAAYRTAQQERKGAPIAWHCPEPVPLAISEMVVMRGSDRRNSALMFVNWFMSKEGQIAQYAANLAPPVHKDLQTKDFLEYPEAIVGKKIAFRDPESMETDLPKLVKFWDPLWLAGRGITLVTVKTKLEDIKRGGRRLVIKNGSETHTVKVSGSRTKVTIKGVPSERKNLKAGMTCEVIYPGKNGEEAKQVACN